MTGCAYSLTRVGTIFLNFSEKSLDLSGVLWYNGIMKQYGEGEIRYE
jgi:hypothetical protein